MSSLLLSRRYHSSKPTATASSSPKNTTSTYTSISPCTVHPRRAAAAEKYSSAWSTTYVLPHLVRSQLDFSCRNLKYGRGLSTTRGSPGANATSRTQTISMRSSSNTNGNTKTSRRGGQRGLLSRFRWRWSDRVRNASSSIRSRGSLVGMSMSHVGVVTSI